MEPRGQGFFLDVMRAGEKKQLAGFKVKNFRQKHWGEWANMTTYYVVMFAK